MAETTIIPTTHEDESYIKDSSREILFKKLESFKDHNLIFGWIVIGGCISHQYIKYRKILQKKFGKDYLPLDALRKKFKE